MMESGVFGCFGSVCVGYGWSGLNCFQLAGGSSRKNAIK